jgi:hypothetical protein
MILVVAVLLPNLLLTSAPAWGQFEFGSTIRPATTGEVLIVEDFASAPGLVQWPVTIMYPAFRINAPAHSIFRSPAPIVE